MENPAVIHSTDCIDLENNSVRPTIDSPSPCDGVVATEDVIKKLRERQSLLRRIRKEKFHALINDIKDEVPFLREIPSLEHVDILDGVLIYLNIRNKSCSCVIMEQENNTEDVIIQQPKHKAEQSKMRRAEFNMKLDAIQMKLPPVLRIRGLSHESILRSTLACLKIINKHDARMRLKRKM